MRTLPWIGGILLIFFIFLGAMSFIGEGLPPDTYQESLSSPQGQAVLVTGNDLRRVLISQGATLTSNANPEAKMPIGSGQAGYYEVKAVSTDGKYALINVFNGGQASEWVVPLSGRREETSSYAQTRTTKAEPGVESTDFLPIVGFVLLLAFLGVILLVASKSALLSLGLVVACIVAAVLCYLVQSVLGLVICIVLAIVCGLVAIVAISTPRITAEHMHFQGGQLTDHIRFKAIGHRRMEEPGFLAGLFGALFGLKAPEEHRQIIEGRK